MISKQRPIDRNVYIKRVMVKKTFFRSVLKKGLVMKKTKEFYSHLKNLVIFFEILIFLDIDIKKRVLFLESRYFLHIDKKYFELK